MWYSVKSCNKREETLRTQPMLRKEQRLNENREVTKPNGNGKHTKMQQNKRHSSCRQQAIIESLFNENGT